MRTHRRKFRGFAAAICLHVLGGLVFCAAPRLNNALDRNSDEFTLLNALTSPAAMLTTSAATLDVIEGTPGVRAGTAAAYTLRMTSAPSGPARVEINFDASLVSVNGAGASPLTISFDAANWTAAQVVTVAAQPDTITGGARTATISHTLGAASVALALPADVTVNIRDDELRVYITTEIYNGALGGISGADNICMTNANYPGTGTYKAMIADNTNRRACISSNCPAGTSENIDWVMYPHTEYRRVDGVTSITTTNAGGVHDFGMGSLTNVFASGPANNWTGMNGGWLDSGVHCMQWTVAAGTGTRGAVNQNNGQLLDFGAGPCSAASFALYCVEQ